MASPTSPLGHNPLDTIRSKLPYALKHGTVEEITRLLEFPGALEVELDFYVPGSTRYPATGFPPLFLAASFKRPERVTLLLDLGANINQKAPCECTVLHLAKLQQTVLEPEKLKILLVDQLWLWIVDESKTNYNPSSCSKLTSFIFGKEQ